MAAFTTVSFFCRPPVAGALLGAMLCACGAPRAPPLTILADRCLPLSGAAPIALHLFSPGGALRITMRPRGIAAAASLSGADSNSAALSPDDRYGAMSFLADAAQARAYTLHIVSRDSPRLAGEVCVAAALLNPSDRVGLAAERAFAAAGEDTRARRWRLAFEHYLAAARLFDRIDRERAAQARQAMAQIAYRQLHRDRDSYVLAQRALLDFDSEAEPGLRSAIVELQATLVVESKDAAPTVRRERALQLLGRSAALAARAAFGAREQARLTLLRGYLEYSTGRGAAAAQFFIQAAAACQLLADSECYARSRMNSAALAEEAGQSSAALKAYAEALQSLSPAAEPDLAADIWDNLGRLQTYLGLFSVAGQSQLNAVRLYAQTGNCDGVRRTLSTLGTMLVNVGKLGEALAYLHLAASHDCAALLTGAADTAYENFQPLNPTVSPAFDRALASGELSRAGCDSPPAPALLSADATESIFRALLELGAAASLEGDRDVAQHCRIAAGAYVNAPRLALRLNNALGLGFLERGEAQAARASFLRALDVADQGGLAATHENRVVAYVGLARAAALAREPRVALDYAARALRLSSARADVIQVANALQALAAGLRQAGASQPALQTLRTAANLIEQAPNDPLDPETRATFLATQHRVFEELTDLLAADAIATDDAAGANKWTAFAASERGRARALQYAISQTSGNEPVPGTSAAGRAALLARIADIAKEADGLRGWSAAIAQLESLSAESAAVTEPLDAAQLLRRLDRLGATFIEFAVGPQDMFAFVIDAGEMHLVSLGDRRRISAAAADLYQALRDPEHAAPEVQGAARRLAQLVLWPLTSHIQKARVIFAADDSLHTVPFAVLPWSQDADAPLLQHAEVSVVPSALFLTQRPAARSLQPSPRFELFGDPVLQAAAWRRDCSGQSRMPSTAAPATTDLAADWTESLPPLPGSRSEVLAIERLARAAWPASRIGVHLGCLATPHALRMAAEAGSDLMHIATHGYVDALRPRLSALVLTREANREGSGVLGLVDILAAHSSARLVVLSACDTSGGRVLPGEGVLGPAQAFLQSGAQGVVASYWRIDDAATAAFMQTFYRHLLIERLPVAAALRRAQLEHANESMHAWAGFALFGWPDVGL